jgi:hypothetical protein
MALFNGGLMSARWVGAFLAAVAVGVACGDHGLGSFDGDGGSGADATSDVVMTSDACMFCGDATAKAPFLLQPSTEQDITVTCGQAPPSVQLSATALDGTTPVSVTWSTDQAAIGTVSPTTGSSTTFTPTGAVGGIVNVLATYQSATLTTPVLVKLTCSENGGCPSSQLATNASQILSGGGIGGVGGEGCGTAVTDTATTNALNAPSNDGSAQNLKLLYPYDKTVWARGLLAPLLQWDWSLGDADAIRIDLATTSQSYTWHGTFTRPAVLSQESSPLTGKFIRHPIPQDVWETATNTAGTLIHGQPDQLTVSVTLARQGQGYGPITNTWTVAPGTLKGTVYYGSYGTRLSTSNWSGLIGASVLSLTHGAASPSLVTSQTQCQVCHSVAAKGANLVAESDPYAGDGNDWDVWYDLTKPTQPQSPGTWLPKTNPGAFTWGATTPDGSLYFTNAAPCWFSQSSSCVNALPSDELEGANDAPSALYTLSNGAGTSAVTATQIGQQLGLTTPLAGALPEFSPDGKHVVFTFFRGGPATDKTSGDGKSLAVVDFDQSTKTFSNLRTIYTPTCSGCTATAPFFLPTSDAVVFEVITRSNGFFGGTTSDRGEDASWSNCPNLVGAHAELWWVDLATKTPHRLDVANGAGYAPTGPNGHGDDTTLQFDPTVAPVVSGGYVWVAFMSRRLYGNVATINPWCSQTNGVDFTPFSENPMTKKLWVTAFDLNAPPGSDASHPAFYLPGQELTAGNFRSFWVLDPCKKDGTSCGTGDECCGGHCVTDTDGGGATCGTPIGCSGEGDTCTTSSTCCSGLQCVGGPDNGHCDVIPVK